mgnify:CR=1 FL=1
MNVSAKRGKMVNGFDPSKVDLLDPRTRDFVDRRAQLLGPAYRLFYANPVEFSRASGVFMYDKDGTEYLDAYNNVVSVGHCHPHVNAAIAAQMDTLCTHTRYMHPYQEDYSSLIYKCHPCGGPAICVQWDVGSRCNAFVWAWFG